MRTTSEDEEVRLRMDAAERFEKLALAYDDMNRAERADDLLTKAEEQVDEALATAEGSM